LNTLAWVILQGEQGGGEQPGGEGTSTGTKAPGSPDQVPRSPSLIDTLVPLLLIGLIFYFIVIRPQRRQQKEKQQMIASLQKNDRVLTQGGIFGTVTALGETEVTLKIDDSNNTKIKLARSAIAGVIKRDDETGEK